jgi:hypothetical protein
MRELGLHKFYLLDILPVFVSLFITVVLLDTGDGPTIDLSIMARNLYIQE